MWYYDYKQETLLKQPEKCWNPYMRAFVIDKYQLIYIRTLKNASTSILTSFGLNYEDSKYYYDIDKSKQNWFTFTILRYPIHRLISAYKFLCRGLDRGDHPNKHLQLSFLNSGNDDKIRFQRFLFDVEHHGFFNQHLFPQTYFLTNQAGKFLDINLFLQFEKLDDQFKEFSSIMCKEVTLCHEKGSSHDLDFESWVVQNYSDVINKIYQEDYDLYMTIFKDK
jgi:hypothetical protein